MKRWWIVPVALGGLLCSILPTEAGWTRHCRSSASGSDCTEASSEEGCGGYVMEPRTVMASVMMTETRLVTATEYRSQTQSRMVTRYRTVPVTEQVPYTYTVMEPQTQSRVVTRY